jgi:hypothetical protein
MSASTCGLSAFAAIFGLPELFGLRRATRLSSPNVPRRSRLYGTYRLCVVSRLDPIDQIRHIHVVSNLDRYERLALELAEFTDLGPAEGIAARISGFRGLIAVGKTRSLAKRELASALHEWISLALARGYGLPRVAKDREESLIER